MSETVYQLQSCDMKRDPLHEVAIKRHDSYLEQEELGAVHSEVCVLPGHVLIDPGLPLQVSRVPVIGHGGRMLLRHVPEDGDAAEIEEKNMGNDQPLCKHISSHNHNKIGVKNLLSNDENTANLIKQM